jgi:hypothetical protein
VHESNLIKGDGDKYSLLSFSGCPTSPFGRSRDYLWGFLILCTSFFGMAIFRDSVCQLFLVYIDDFPAIDSTRALVVSSFLRHELCYVGGPEVASSFAHGASSRERRKMALNISMTCVLFVFLVRDGFKVYMALRPFSQTKIYKKKMKPF